MVLSYRETGKCVKYPDNLPWRKKFAWIPTRVDDGRIVWLEFVMIVTRTRKWPIDFK